MPLKVFYLLVFMHFMIKYNVNNVHMLTKEDTNQESAKSVANILEDALCGHYLP